MAVGSSSAEPWHAPRNQSMPAKIQKIRNQPTEQRCYAACAIQDETRSPVGWQLGLIAFPDCACALFQTSTLLVLAIVMSAPSSPANALASHLLTQTASAIAILESLNVINPQDANIIRSKLPSPSGPFPSLEPASPRHDMSASFQTLSMGTSSPSVPALPARRVENRAKALWDYHGTVSQRPAFPELNPQADRCRPRTISLSEQEISLLLTRKVSKRPPRSRISWIVNEQWYRGRVIPPGQSVPLDRAGLFPSNYIEKL